MLRWHSDYDNFTIILNNEPFLNCAKLAVDIEKPGHTFIALA